MFPKLSKRKLDQYRLCLNAVISEICRLPKNCAIITVTLEFFNFVFQKINKKI